MYEDIAIKLRQTLSKQRYEHSVRVAQTAHELAGRFNVDQNKAYLAGLLHDCAREMSSEALIAHVRTNNVHCCEDDMQGPMLLHTHVGADIAQKNYGINDADILGAIRHHTVGGADMSPLEKIVYVADFIEPGRKDIDVQHVHDALDRSLDAAVYEKAKFMVEYSKKIKEKVHPDVLATVTCYKPK